MLAWCLGLFLCAAWPAQAVDSTYVGYDGKEHRNPVPVGERERLRRFLGLRHHGHHSVVIQPAPVIHHGLHMLNHQVDRVGPLQAKMLKPFGKANHTLHNLSHSHSLGNETIIATYGAQQKAKPDWDAIKIARADMCVKMLKKHGLDFDVNKDACIGFMDKTCKVPPGKGANHIENPTEKGICQEWYRLLNMVKAGKDPNEEGGALGAAPSPAVAASPASPASAAPKGISNDAKPPSWSNRMDEGVGMPEQGFQGKLVAHDNMVTQTSDWHLEYGPHVHQSYEAICAQYPDNAWCKLRGYHTKKPAPKSGAAQLRGVLLTLSAALFVSLSC